MIDSLLDLVDGLLEILYGLDPLLLALGTMVFTALETTILIGLLVPGDAAVLLAGSTVDSPAKYPLMVAAGAIGSYAGEIGGYALGRLVGPRLRYSRLGRWLGERRWAAAEAYLAGRGAPSLVPARFVSVVHAVAPLLAGTVRMPLRKFLFWAGLGALLWSCFYTALGTAVGAAYREYRGLGLVVSLVVIVISMVAMQLRRLIRRRRRARRRAEKEPTAAGAGSSAPPTGV